MEVDFIQPIDAWSNYKELKPVLIKKYGGCQSCKNDNLCELVIHHVTYKRYSNEKISDLRLLCFRCHDNFHKMFNGSDPYLRQMTDIFIGRDGIW